MPKRSDNNGGTASDGSLHSSRAEKQFSRSRLAKSNLKRCSARSVHRSPPKARTIIVQPGREAGYQVSVQPPLAGCEPILFDQVEFAVKHAFKLKAEFGYPIKSSGELA